MTVDVLLDLEMTVDMKLDSDTSCHAHLPMARTLPLDHTAGRPLFVVSVIVMAQSCSL